MSDLDAQPGEVWEIGIRWGIVGSEIPSEDARVLRTPVQARKANAYAERWVGTVRAECLDWLMIVGRGHLERILRVTSSTTTGIVRTGR